MKRLLALLLAIVMIFSLCACSDVGGDDDDEDDRYEDDKDKDEEEEEEPEYPLEYEFTLYDMEYTLKIEDKKNVRLSMVQMAITEDELEDMDIEVDDAQVQMLMTMVGKYKVKKGIYSLELDQLLYSMEITGKDDEEAKVGLLEYFSDFAEAELYEDMLNGKEVDMTEEADYPGGRVDFEIDGEDLESMTVYEEDGETIQSVHTFYSNGMVKKTVEYWEGEPDYYYEYDKNGDIKEEGSLNDEDDDDYSDEPWQEPEVPETTPPTMGPPAETMPAPTEPVEQKVYDVTIWVSEQEGMAELYRQQIERFLSDHPDIQMNYYIECVTEADASSKVLADVYSAPDIYCFTQDQLSRLVDAGALSALDYDASDWVYNNNDYSSCLAATMYGSAYAYPMTSDNGYYLYYDKSIISEEDADSLEAIIAACEANGVKFRYALENAWYTASFFFATGCESEWYMDEYGDFIGVFDTFNSYEGILAYRGMQKLALSSCYDSDADTFADTGAIVTGIWNAQAAAEHFGNNLGATDLPSFEVDGYSYHLSSFSGHKLMGVKPQYDYEKEVVLHMLAQYLTGEDCQMERYDSFQWGPSNIYIQASDAVQANVSLAALMKQNEYAHPQGAIHGAWWDIAKLLGVCAQSGVDAETALWEYQTSIDSLFGMSEEDQIGWTVIGNICGTSWDVDLIMYQMDDVTWVSDVLYLSAGEEFKVRQGMAWDYNFGYEFNGANYIVPEDGEYQIVFTYWGGTDGYIELIPIS